MPRKKATTTAAVEVPVEKKTRKRKQAPAPENLVYDVKASDWHKGEDAWYRMIQNGTRKLGYDNLFDFQKQLWAVAKQNQNLVRGFPVMVVATVSGDMYTGHPYPATILRAFEEAGNLYFTVVYHPIEEETWTDEKIEQVRLYQVIPVLDLPTPTTKAMQEAELALTLTQMNISLNSSLVTLRNQEQNCLQRIESLQRDLMSQERLLKETQDQLKAAAKDFLTADDLKSIIDDLAQHKKVAWAMLTSGGDLVIETTNIPVIRQKTGKEDPKKMLGRFAFKISPRNQDMYAMGLDYSYSGYTHPNINGSSICKGGNAQEITTMIKQGQFYALVDFMIMFFSLFPSDEGRPFVSHSDFLRYRKATPQTNPWANQPYIYKVEQDKEIAERKTTSKRVSLRTKIERKLTELAHAKAAPAIVEDEDEEEEDEIPF